MPKAGERSYFSAIGELGQSHSLNKPFSDPNCAVMLAGMAAIFRLLPPPPAAVLDLGCGTGWTSQMLARRGYAVTGQDISEEALALAHDHAAANGLSGNPRFVARDYEQIGEADETGGYDAAIFYDSLHHAEDERVALACAWRALKPGGILITHEPGEGHATEPASIAAMARFGVTEKDMPPHHIIALGMDIGFSAYRIFPLPEDVLHGMYGIPSRKTRLGRRPSGIFANLTRTIRLARHKGMHRMAFPSDRSAALVLLVK